MSEPRRTILAKDLLKALQGRDPHAIERVRLRNIQFSNLTTAQTEARSFKLSDAQFVIAREQGFDSWSKLKKQIEPQMPDLPKRRPKILIDRLDMPKFAIKSAELLFWHIKPELGQMAVVASYGSPAWKLIAVDKLHVLGKATIHGKRGVEVKWTDLGREGWLETQRRFLPE